MRRMGSWNVTIRDGFTHQRIHVATHLAKMTSRVVGAPWIAKRVAGASCEETERVSEVHREVYSGVRARHPPTKQDSKAIVTSRGIRKRMGQW